MLDFMFVSKREYTAMEKQIADLKEANAKLWELVGAKQGVPESTEPGEEPAPPRPHRILGAEMRARWRREADERARQQGVTK
jgi:hypothetical protein